MGSFERRKEGMETVMRIVVMLWKRLDSSVATSW